MEKPGAFTRTSTNETGADTTTLSVGKLTYTTGIFKVVSWSFDNILKNQNENERKKNNAYVLSFLLFDSDLKKLLIRFFKLSNIIFVLYRYLLSLILQFLLLLILCRHVPQ